MRRASLILLALLGAANAGCGDHPILYVGRAAVDPLPLTWQEHWFQHTQLLDLVTSNDDVAFYFDKDVDRAHAAWLFPFITQAWRYSLSSYGRMGPGRLYAIFHQDRYIGCHAATHFSPSHDNRNVIDCGFATTDTVEQVGFQATHVVANVVEAASDNKEGSPAMVLWGDSKWAEFFQYDMYRGTGDTAEADHLIALWTAATWNDSFPVAGTHWFRDWFFPLWRDHGGAALMARFFASLAQRFPSTGTTYDRDMNWGEFVHFMSGAAATDLKPLATTAFGWPAQWEAQYQAARAAFPQIMY